MAISPIFQRPDSPDLFRQIGDTEFTRIADPTELNLLAEAGQIEVDKERPFLPEGAQITPAKPPDAPGATVAPTTTPTTPTTAIQPQVGSFSAFTQAFTTVMDRANRMESLRQQKNKLMKSLFDERLTPEEIGTLSPGQVSAIESGNRDVLELEIMSINDVIKGREDTLATSLSYLFTGARLDFEQAETLRKESQTRKDRAMKILLDSGVADTLDKDVLASILETGVIDEDSLALIAAGVKEQSALTGGTAGIKEFNLAVKQGFTGSFLDYKQEVARRTRKPVGVGVKTTGELKDLQTQLNNFALDKAAGREVPAWAEEFLIPEIKDGIETGDVVAKKLIADDVAGIEEIGRETTTGEIAAREALLDPTSVARSIVEDRQAGEGYEDIRIAAFEAGVLPSVYKQAIRMILAQGGA